jgi:hypothetical protein
VSETSAVVGVAFVGSDRPSKASKKGRVCKDPSCETRLSVYNHGSYCYQHEPMAVPRTRGRKIA